MAGSHAQPTDRPPRAHLAESLAPLAVRPYRLLWIGQNASAAGSSLTQVAIVFAVLRIGGTAADIGYIAAIQTVVMVVFILAGGVWADRLRRQFVMLVSDLLRAAVQAALAALLMTGQARVWELCLGAALFGAAQAFFGPASTGLLPETLPAEKLQQGNALMSLSSSICYVGGPAAAGVLIAAFGPGLVFAMDASSFIVSAISLAMLRLAPRNMPERGSFRSDLTAGWHEMAIRPWYWLNLIAHALWNFAIPAYYVLGPVIAARMLGGPSAWGVICACWAAGAIAGPVLALRFRPRRPLVSANLALLLTTLVLLALVPPLATWAIGIASFMSGLGLIYLNTVWTATMQQLIPDEVRSRVDSYDWLISLVVMPVGYVMVGPLAARIGNAATLLGAAVLIGVPCGLAALLPGVRAVHRTAEGKIFGPPVRQARQAATAGADRG